MVAVPQDELSQGLSSRGVARQPRAACGGCFVSFQGVVVAAGDSRPGRSHNGADVV